MSESQNADPGDVPTATAQERAALAAWLLMQGGLYTTAQIAERVGLSREGAHAILDKISRSIPIWQDERGRWQLCYESRIALGMGPCGQDPRRVEDNP